MSEWIRSWQKIADEMGVCTRTVRKYQAMGLKVIKIGAIVRTKPEWIEEFLLLNSRKCP